MTRLCLTVVFCLTCVLGLTARAARAQMVESVGIRAQGMGGAFVAVADDATATWWNPAGVAAGAYFNGLVEYDRPQTPADTSVRAVAVAFPALGLSYYRLPISQMRPSSSVAAGSIDRQNEGYLSEFGATVGQSIGRYLVVSSTLKLVRAADTHGDLDVGALATLGRVRIGVTVRNLTEPTVGDQPDPLTLKRQVRVGGAFMYPGSVMDRLVIAVDGDLTRVSTAVGDERHLSAGAELWVWRRAVGIRGGVSAETVNKRASASGGLSLLLQSGRYLRTYADGQFTGGTDEVRRGWGVGLRLTF
jgi:hypothetical protein